MTAPDGDPRRIFTVVIILLPIIGIATSFAIATPTGWETAYGPDTPATVPEWTPPPPPAGADLAPRDYLLMWNGMETIPDVAAHGFGDNLTQQQQLKVIAARRDNPEPRPPDTQHRWNKHTASELHSTPPTESQFPAGTSRRATRLFRDAYLRIGAITPSTYYHANGTTTRQVKDHGGILLASDYRVEPPTKSIRVSDVDTDPNVVDVRLKYELKNTTEDPIRVLATDPTHDTPPASVTATTTPTTGGSYVTYEDLTPQTPDNQVVLLAAQNFSVAFLEHEQHRTCDDPENRTRCQWATVNTSVLTENITVTDEALVSLPAHTANIKYRPGQNQTYLQVPHSRAWSAVTYGTGDNTSVFSDHHAFVTKRNHRWDTFRTATPTGTSDPSPHPFTPVETHAVPAYNGSYLYTPPERYGQLAVHKRTVDTPHSPYQPAPRHVNLTTTTADGYRHLESATLAIHTQGDGPAYISSSGAEAADQIAIHPAVNGDSVDTHIRKYPPTRQAALNVTAKPVFNNDDSVQPEYFDITVRLTDASSGDPIRTAGTNRTIRFSSGTTIETNASGIATYHGRPANFSQTGIVAWFDPQAPFDGKYHYSTARGGDTASYPLRYITHALTSSAQTLVGILLGLLPLAVVVAVTYTAVTGRQPW
jgi:hypothetical protein